MAELEATGIVTAEACPVGGLWIQSEDEHALWSLAKSIGVVVLHDTDEIAAAIELFAMLEFWVTELHTARAIAQALPRTDRCSVGWRIHEATNDTSPCEWGEIVSNSYEIAWAIAYDVYKHVLINLRQSHVLVGRDEYAALHNILWWGKVERLPPLTIGHSWNGLSSTGDALARFDIKAANHAAWRLERAIDHLRSTPDSLSRELGIEYLECSTRNWEKWVSLAKHGMPGGFHKDGLVTCVEGGKNVTGVFRWALDEFMDQNPQLKHRRRK